MTVASYERDPAKPGECLFPVVPKIIASTTPATTTSTRPTTRLTPQNTRSPNRPNKPLDIPTSFILIAARCSISVDDTSRRRTYATEGSPISVR